MITGRQTTGHLQQFIRKNHDLIVKWYQDDHLSWTVIAARLNQCLRGGGISAPMLQACLPYLKRIPRSVALEVVASTGWQQAEIQVQTLQERVRQQEELIRLQGGRVRETARRWARLEELLTQLMPLIKDARSSAERLPRNHPVARHLRERLEQLDVILGSTDRETEVIESLTIVIAALEQRTDFQQDGQARLGDLNF